MLQFRCSLTVLVVLGLFSSAQAETPKPAVRLAVLVVFDQLRGDYLQRWDDLYVADGFHRLERGGVWFQNCHYPYAGTETGPGHASLATGTSGDRHGIIYNEWYDRNERDLVYCAGDLRYQRVPAAPKQEPANDPAAKETKVEKPKSGGTPTRLLAPTLADALKSATGGKAKVVSLSMKDRSAALPGGQRPDACYWFDTTDGRFVTSTYYRDSVHSWVAEYNATKPADAWFGKEWTRLRTDLDYEKYSGPDDVVGEDVGYGEGRTFPHPLDGGLKKPGKKFYDALYTSPHGNEVLLALVKRAIDAEKLGTHDVPDLLSFSCNDPIGHNWGPDSQEVLDVTLRSDLIVKELLDHLDARVGKDKYILALSADHGVSPLPEVAARQGKDAKRVIAADQYQEINDFLKMTFPVKTDLKPVKKLMNESVYLNSEWVKVTGAEQSKIEEALARWLKTRPVYQTAYTRSQLLQGIAEDDALGQMVRRSFHPDRSGDVMMVLKPYHIIWSRLKGTGHGTPHPYDTHVPLVVFGPGLVTGTRKDRVTPQANVAILAHALGIQPPATADAPLPEKVFAR